MILINLCEIIFPGSVLILHLIDSNSITVSDICPFLTCSLCYHLSEEYKPVRYKGGPSLTYVPAF